MRDRNQLAFDTRCIHAGQAPGELTVDVAGTVLADVLAAAADLAGPAPAGAFRRRP